jgi:hypothetical protein
VASASPSLVVLDLSGILLFVHLEFVGNVTYVDSMEGSLTLTELPRFPMPGAEQADGAQAPLAPDPKSERSSTAAFCLAAQVAEGLVEGC